MDSSIIDHLQKLAQQKAIIRMLESSGGKNFDHEPLTSGPNAGQTAGGAYGIVPNSLKDFANQSMNREIPVDLDVLTNMDRPAPEVTNLLNKDRGFDEKSADMALELLNRKYGNDEKAAYAWRTGHNQSLQDVNENYFDHPYVKAYRLEKQKLQNRQPATDGLVRIRKMLGM